MNDENKINYYAVIPATVRYDKRLKFAERLLYGEITALANRNGYCYAQNRYFAELYNVSIETISRWLSHLQQQGYIQIEIKRNDNKEIIARYIYIVDTPYCQKNQYPYCLKSQEGIDEKVKENNINNNIDDLFNLIINNSIHIPSEFYLVLEKLDFIYTLDILQQISEENKQKIKEIIYTLYCIYNSNFKSILSIIERETLVKLYISCKDHNTNDFFNYYKQAIINRYSGRSWNNAR